MSHFHNNALIGASGQGGGYNLESSLRFRSSASSYLSRTFASAGNLKKWTLSVWLKLSDISSNRQLFSGGSATSDQIWFSSASQKFDVYINGISRFTTASVFRDPSSWYHIIVVYDSANATASNRIIVYVNGVQQTNTASAIPQNTNSKINTASGHTIGRYAASALEYIDGYLTEVNFVDGQALTANDFGETDEDTGVWKPIEYTGTYGTNGFYLDGSGVTDGSGNGNNWTNNNLNLSNSALTTYDLMNDVPTLTDEDTANFCTYNPNTTMLQASLASGSLDIVFAGSGGSRYGAVGTMGMSSGKWYWETKITGTASSTMIGITQYANSFDVGTWPGAKAGDYGYNGNGNLYTNSSSSAYGGAMSTGDVIGIALDMDAGTLTFYKNNVSQGVAATGLSGTYFAASGQGQTSIYPNQSVNFGQRPFAYTPPTGYKKLNTYNLPDSNIVDGSQYFDTLLYTGNGSNRSITGLEFSPDLVIGQSRSNAYGNWWFDTVRGATKQIQTFVTNGESTQLTMVTAFNSDGFDLGTDTAGNGNGATFVAWNWRGSDSAAVTNTDGTITSTVSANPTAGFSIVTYTGNGTNGASIGHGLGTVPKAGFFKKRNSAESWSIFVDDGDFTWSSDYYHFDSGGKYTNYGMFHSAPTSSTVKLGSIQNINGNGSTYVGYLWTDVEGFSKIGKYTGNGSTNGPFIYTGFRPAFILHKRRDAGENWSIWTPKAQGNGISSSDNFYLVPNSSGTQDTTQYIDTHSNGFKIRDSGAFANANGGIYIYMVFAENPFKNSLAR